MILDIYQCSSCYFEDKEPSTRIGPDTISERQPRKEFIDALVVFVCVEMYDGREELEQAAKEFNDLSDMIGKRPIVLCPNVHLSIDNAPEKQAVWVINQLTEMLKKNYTVHQLSFGYHKKYGMECNGNVGSVVGRRFYGSDQKQFLRLLTRLGVCPPESLPSDIPAWFKPLTERRLKVLISRKQTYDVAKKMLQNQLDATGHSELWTCMLFEGEREPVEDYISTLDEIIEEYPDVIVHRAINMSVPGLSNAARSLLRDHHSAIEVKRLLIYNSTVSDIEFLLTRTAVLLAFPKESKKPGSYTGEISFGIYCNDHNFANKLITWYEKFLIDNRFGTIKSQ
ncbi:MAG: threonyl-tRNA synthetase editing domain-containing protein, partial [Planctomycetota bacterium]